MLRRDFLHSLSLAMAASSMAPARGDWFAVPFPAPSEDGPEADAHTYQLFQDPPSCYRPMVRWWWNGDRVTGTELLRELEVLQAAGIGGVEINPIKFPAQADPLETKALVYLSDEWIQTLAVVLRGAKERDLTCDMIVGSGWPFGGEFLPRADQTQMVALGTRDVSGPVHLTLTQEELIHEVNPPLVSPYRDALKELIHLTLVPLNLEAETEQIVLNNQLGKNEIAIEIPPGKYVLYFLVKLTGFMAVINGAPGADGPVLNHYDAGAVKRYLNRISDKLSAKLGPLHQQVRAFFTDSIELEGANWCNDMPEQFRQRRGYDLLPWLPFVLFKVGEMGNPVSGSDGATFSAEFKSRVELVRYDFETLKRQLFQERFVQTFVDWCHSIGVKSRMQAYGRECDVMTGSMTVDIPECETWIRSEQIMPFGIGDYRIGRDYTMINKFVSSAAHLAHKQLVSCEEMTNTDDPFHTSLDRIKVAGDQSLLSGVTQSVLHGFNYSPPSAPFPGWVRYGTYFSERNTWWPYFKLWADYIARLSALFQNSVMQADIAILPPMADLAAIYGFQRDPFPSFAYPHYVFKLWEAVHQNGNGCDYVSEEIIRQSRVENGRLVFGQRSYKALLLADLHSLEPETAERLSAFVQSGGTILFLERAPDMAPGFVDEKKRSKVVSTSIEDLRQNDPARVAVIPVDESNMVDWYRSLQQSYAFHPYVSISDPTDYVSQLHYRDGSRDIYFFSNYSPDTSHSFTARFDTHDKSSWLWDALTGKRTRQLTPSSEHGMTIALGPSESKLIVFEPESRLQNANKLAQDLPEHAARQPSERTNVQPLEGPWQVRLTSIAGAVESMQAPDLQDRGLQEHLHSFAGTVSYKTKVNIPKGSGKLWLDLGHLHDVSKVTLNGRAIGVRWFGKHVYDLSADLSAAARPGVNELEIDVVTTLGNYMKTLKDNATARVWTENTPSVVSGLRNPVLLKIQHE